MQQNLCQLWYDILDPMLSIDRGEHQQGGRKSNVIYYTHFPLNAT